MSPAFAHDPTRDLGGRISRALILASLVAAPLAMGAVKPWAFAPLLIVSAAAGLLSLAREGRHVPNALWTVPGMPLLLAFLALLLFQVLPLPPAVLRVLSPGTFQLSDSFSLVSLETWVPISVHPTRTLRGIAFCIGFTLLYAAVQREAGDHPRWRRATLAAIVATGVVLTVVALVQAASPRPHHFYGIWRARPAWAVFGPYYNRNHLAGYLAMAIPIALAFLIEAIADLASAWRRRRPRWLALGDAVGSRVARRALVALTLLVGILAAGSRGAIGGCVAGLGAVWVAVRRARLAALALLLLALLALLFVDPLPIRHSFETRGIAASRVPIWRDVWGAVPSFPLFGAGFNAYPRLARQIQTFDKGEWASQAHNEYLQILIDTGAVGAALMLALLFLLARRALERSRHTTLDAGAVSALVALAVHNIVDFNWQIPANAATFIVLAGLIMRRGETMAGAQPRRSAPLETPRRAPSSTVSP